MAKQKLITFDAPLKGWDINWGKNAQPKGTSTDLLNVLAYDAGGRARGGQRMGVSKALNQDLTGGGDGQVRLLQQVTLAGLQQGPENLFTDDFDYSDGDLETVGGAVWKNKFCAANSKIMVSGEKVVRTATGDAPRCYLLADSISYSYDEPYTITATVQLGPKAENTQTVKLYCKMNDAALQTNWEGISFSLERSGTTTETQIAKIVSEYSVASNHGLTTVTLAAGTIPDSTPFTMKLVVTGNTYTGYINGTAVVTNNFTWSPPGDPRTHYPGNFGVGIYIVSPSGWIDDFAVEHSDDPGTDRETKLVAICSRDVYVGDLTTLTKIDDDVTDPSRVLSWCELFGRVFVVDGAGPILEIDLANNVVNELEANPDKGTAPTNCIIVAAWRGRLCTVSKDDPQNVVMSAGPTGGNSHLRDWLTGQDTDMSAVALNASGAGSVGERIRALIPFRDDTLLILCDHSVWALQGDPAASSGQLVQLSSSVGGVQQSAWCADPEAAVYFVGTGGLYRVAGSGGALENLSKQKVAGWFDELEYDVQGTKSTGGVIRMAWDVARDGCWIFYTPSTAATGEAKAMFYDRRLDAFFPAEFPDTFGPMSMIVWDADEPEDRCVLLGGRDGYIRKIDPAATNDDGTAITSRCVIGPVQPFGDFDDAMITEFNVILGDVGAYTSSTALSACVLMGNEPQTALEAAPVVLDVFEESGRQGRIRKRLRANAFYLSLTNSTLDKSWAIERIQATAEYGGPNRG